VDDYVIDGDLAFTNTRAALEFYREQYHKKKEWVGLTRKERLRIWGQPDNFQDPMRFARAIEAKLKEKNT